MNGRKPHKTPGRCTISAAAGSIICLLIRIVLGAYAELTFGSDHFHFRRARMTRSFMGTGRTVRDETRTDTPSGLVAQARSGAPIALPQIGNVSYTQ